MQIVDTALKARAAANNPVKVAMIGAGFMARGITNQILNSVPGMRLTAIANRTLSKAQSAYEYAGAPADSVTTVSKASELNDAIRKGKYAVTDDALLLCEAEGVECLIDVTGDVELGARLAMRAIERKKHLILMNAEVDGTVGPILKVYADKAGVILSGCDGDQPGVQMNLFRFVKSIGCTPLLMGNIKGLQDPYRTPTTQEGFAKKWGQNPWMVTSFADGTKISFEQSIVANATNMTVAKRGMYGYDHLGHVDELTKRYDIDQLKGLGGIVDYVVGAKPGPGIFCLATHDDPKQKHYLNLYKLGEGPLYSFYTPWHLCHFEAPLAMARAVLFRDHVITPTFGPKVDVITTAKKNLKAGETIDALGGYMTYGQAERYDVSLKENLLPLGLAEGSKLKRDIAKDEVLTYADVEMPAGRVAAKLRREQDAHFGPKVGMKSGQAQVKPSQAVKV
jgi:predicted homoserine dehydrogenase-like protein